MDLQVEVAVIVVGGARPVIVLHEVGGDPAQHSCVCVSEFGETVRTVAVALKGIVAARVAPNTVEDQQQLPGSHDYFGWRLGETTKVGPTIRGPPSSSFPQLDVGPMNCFWQIAHVPFEVDSLFGGHPAPFIDTLQKTGGRSVFVAPLAAQDAGARSGGRVGAVATGERLNSSVKFPRIRYIELTIEQTLLLLLWWWWLWLSLVLLVL